MLSFWKGGEISDDPGSVDELSTGHFNMPYDMVREGKESLVLALSNPPLQAFLSEWSVKPLTSFHSASM